MKKTVEGHDNRDAYQLYWYACVGNMAPRGSTVVRENHSLPCAHQELIWNSRDGVVPFGTKCPSCEHGMLQHVNWPLDRYAKDHVLRPFQKYWADMSEERARALAKAVIIRATEYVKNNPGYLLPNEDELVKAYMGEFGGHAPMLCVYQGP